MSEGKKCGNCGKCKCPTKPTETVTNANSLANPPEGVKYKTLRFRKFEPTTGRVQTIPHGGILMAFWGEGDRLKATFVVCPPDAVFHKPTAIRKLDFSKTCSILGTGELDVIFASDVSDPEFFANVKNVACEIYDNASSAFDDAEKFKDKLKYSGATVYRYVG